MGLTFTMNVFGFEAALCMISVLDWCDSSVDVPLYQFIPQHSIYNNNSNQS